MADEQAEQVNDKRIFSFKIGADEHRLDPLEVLMGLTEAEASLPKPLAELERDLAGAEKDPQTFVAALRQLLPVIDQVFGLKPFDPKTGEGQTAAERVAAYHRYGDFMASLKKSTEETPISPPPTASEPSNTQPPSPTQSESASS